MTVDGAKVRLEHDAVQLWLLELDVDAVVAGDFALLSAHERARATSFRFERDRARFVARRAALRRVLGGCVGAPPAALVLEEPPGDRPRLGGGGEDLAFSTSSSGARGAAPGRDVDRADDAVRASAAAGAVDAVGAIAVASGGVGVDVERRRALRDAAALARRHFDAAELRAYLAAPDPDAAFLGTWTRKEAFLKLLGLGLVDDLAAVHVGPAGAPGDGSTWGECRYRRSAHAHTGFVRTLWFDGAVLSVALALAPRRIDLYHAVDAALPARRID